MRLYLSSWRLGNRPDALLSLTSGPGKVAVICNALDAQPDYVRNSGVLAEVKRMIQIGYDAEEVDLRSPGAAQALHTYDMTWVRGGNVFALRDAMARNGADSIMIKLIREEKIVYAGYSAGCCVLAPTLYGLEKIDDPHVVDTPMWEGLGLLDYAILPHYRSDHPESALVEKVARTYQELNTPHRTIRDGEVIIAGL